MARTKRPVRPLADQWDIVEVVWLDAYGPESEMSLKSAAAMDPIERRSVGYCINLTKDKIVIAETDDRAADSSHVCDLASVIPMPWVQKLTVLRKERHSV